MNNEPHQHGSSSNQTQLQTSATRNDSPQDLVQNPHVSEPTLHLHRPRPNLNPKATIKRDAFALNHCFVILSQWQVSRYARHQTDETLERVSTLLNIPNAKFWSNPTIGRNQLEEHVAYAVMCAVCSYGYHHLIVDEKPWFVVVGHPEDHLKPVPDWLKNKPFMVFRRDDTPILQLTGLQMPGQSGGIKREAPEEEMDVKRPRI